jgi:hypothetical protein
MDWFYLMMVGLLAAALVGFALLCARLERRS